MSIELCILASGSAGNSAILRTPAGVVLIDAGIGPRTTARRLEGTGVEVADIGAICLTHLDRDHFNLTWIRTIVARGIRVFCHVGRTRQLAGCADRGPRPLTGALSALVRAFDGVSFEPVPGLSVRPVRLPHDRSGTHGFLIEGFGCRLGYATDLGRVPEELMERFANVDVLALESNYDPQMQLDSQRPSFLKRRIMGGAGHLSNEQAFSAVRQILNRSQANGGRLPHRIILLHRSRQCNCPSLVRELFARDARVAPRLRLAEQHERSEWLRIKAGQPVAGEQLMLAWG